MNILKSRIMMAAYLAMAWGQIFNGPFYHQTNSPAWAPKRKKFKGYQKQARQHGK